MSAAKRPIAGRASKSNPCPACEAGSKGCSWTDDGMHLCRVPGADPAVWKDVLGGKPDTAGFHHYRRADDATHLNGKPHIDPKPTLGKSKAKPKPHPKLNAKPDGPKTWREQAEKFATSDPAAIAANLKLPVEAFTGPAPCLLLGYTEHGMKDGAGEWVGAVTFPMVDGQREPCGILKRLDLAIADTHKYTMPGGEPGKTLGLFIGREWSKRPGPLLIPEGGSDVVALAICGLAAIGRPSNVTGAELLAEVLRDFPEDRPIIVIGENDKRFDALKNRELWPGKEGIDAVAPKLAGLLGRPVLAAYPPEGMKDARVWVQELLTGQAELDLASIGETIRHHVEATASPPDDETATLTESRFTFIDSATFAAGDYRPQWHVSQLLVKHQPAVIAGPPKSLKTSYAIDLAASLASGLPFLGTFKTHQCRVAIASGESGAHTLQETAKRVCKSKGIDLGGLGDMLQWDFTLPTFSDHDSMKDFAENHIAKMKTDLTIIDPLYLALGAIDARNLFEMGAALRVVAESLLRAGSTPLIIHHSNGSLETGSPMELCDLAYTGLEQFARQWLLLNRSKAYQGKGTHELWMSAGGSAGHGGIWALEIAEGVVNEDFSGREWNVTLQSKDDSVKAMADKRDTDRTEKARRKLAHDRAEVLSAIDAEDSAGNPATQTRIRDRTGYGAAKVKQVVGDLIDLEAIEPVDFEKAVGNKAKVKMTGYSRCPVEH